MGSGVAVAGMRTALERLQQRSSDTNQQKPIRRPRGFRRKPIGSQALSPDQSARLPARQLEKYCIAGIGASAGGLEAFTQLLQHLPHDTGMAFVLVQHLDPEHESALVQILSRLTKMPVYEVTNNTRVAPNGIYVIPPNAEMRLVKGVLRLKPRMRSAHAHHSIDIFFESLAEDLGERAIGVVLSGTASDGTLGLEAIKAANGITVAQDGSAKYESMPRCAIASGCVDMVLAPDVIAGELARIARHPYVLGQSALISGALSEDRAPSRAAFGARGQPLPITADSNVFEHILLLLYNRAGVDLSQYKSSSLERRIMRRMVLAKAETPSRYLESLLADPEELQRLYGDLLICVTEFFRNPEVFETLKKSVIRDLVAKNSGKPLRVWVPACATGQEAYSFAMAFMECVEDNAAYPALQIFATDVNEAVLNKGRAGLYTRSSVQNISPARLKRFFVEEPLGYRVAKELRQLVVFARQNVLVDPPFSRIDIVSCRNLLIYLEPTLQEKVLVSFHYALKEDGCLLLGLSESIGRSTDLFAVRDKKLKIYRKSVFSAPLFSPPPRVEGIPKSRSVAVATPLSPAVRPAELSPEREADRVTFKHFAPPGVLVDANLQIVQFRGQTSPYLNPPTHSADFGLLAMAAEGVLLPLRTALEKAQRTLRPVRQHRVSVEDSGRLEYTVDIEVIPLIHLKDLHYLVVFLRNDRSAAHLLTAKTGSPPDTTIARRENKHREARRINVLEQKLQEARDYIDALQTHDKVASAEAQATNEDVQSANEELQSMNEELETSKEELESTNEELITVNEEMISRNAELNHLNADLSNLHLSINLPILVLGHDLVIRHFTPPAEPLFNLMVGDVGRPLGRLKHNLVGVNIEQFIADSVASVRMSELEVQDKNGRWYTLRVRPYLTLDRTIQGAVVVLIDIDDLKRNVDRLTRARNYSEAILRAARDPLLVLGRDLRINATNDAFRHMFKLTRDNTEGRLFFDLSDGAWNIPKLRSLVEDILPRNSFFDDLDITQNFPIIGKRLLRLSGRPLDYEEGLPQMALLSIHDVTAEHEALKTLRTSENRFRRLFDTAQDGILLIDPVTRKILDANPSAVDMLRISLDTLLGQELWEVGLLKDESSSHAIFRELQKQGSIRLTVALRGAHIGLHPIELLGKIYLEGGYEVIQCNLRDIGARPA